MLRRRTGTILAVVASLLVGLVLLIAGRALMAAARQTSRTTSDWVACATRWP
jgi:uncharacterized membrane protein HdeD (DUF308 family)